MKGKLGTIIAFFTLKILGFNRINANFSKISQYKNEEFTKKVIEIHNVTCDVNLSELDYIPKEGPFITVSNHPYGVIDGMILFSFLRTIRPDFKAVANFILSHIENVNDCVFPVNPFSEHKKLKSSFSGIKMAMGHLENGGALGLFPAGKVSTYQNKKYTEDISWQKSIIKLVLNSNVPIIPIYFDGTNSRTFHLLGKIHPLLRTLRLPRELTGSYGKTIAMRIGKPIPVSEILEYPDFKDLSKYLRARTYALEANLNLYSVKNLPKEEATTIHTIEKEKLIKEIKALDNPTNLLFKTANYHCYLSDYSDIPNIIQEIGRKREGLNSATGLDMFDKYYKHLILWDSQQESIVGTYRLGIGSEIIKEYGVEGFYSSTLFKYSKEFHSTLSSSIELECSFVSAEHQKEPLSPILMKGLLQTVRKYTDCKYVLGPISINSCYPHFYQSLIINYLERTQEISLYSKKITPRTPFSHNFLRVDVDSLISNKISSVDKFDRFLLKLSNNEYRLPTLLKEHLKLNSKIIGFSLDKDFNSRVNCLALLDLAEIPNYGTGS